MIKAEYVDHMGDELTIVNAARVSFGSKSEELSDKDEKLIKYLADHKHMSPFEHCQLSVKISCPLYIRSQIHRHRTFSYNEISRRYTEKDMNFYLPDVFRKQHESNRQASYGVVDGGNEEAVRVEMEEHHSKCLDYYHDLLAIGVCKEQARGVLPQNLMTEFYMTGNLRNWVHFINLRDHEGAQVEVQIIARQIKDILIDKFRYSAKILLEKES